MSKKRFFKCQMIRTFVRTSYQMNILTGEESDHVKHIVTDRCRSPLFGESDQESGYCSGCGEKKWEVPNNRFATESERIEFLKNGPVITRID